MGKHWKSIMIKWITCFAFHHGAKPFLKLQFFLFNFTKYHQTLKAKNDNITLKVRWNRNVFLGSSILPKNELENFNFCPSLLGQTFFIRFLEELKTQKSPFEIDWPLGEWANVVDSFLSCRRQAFITIRLNNFWIYFSSIFNMPH